MIVLPFQINARQYSVYIGFDEEGLERMKAYDPGEVVVRDWGLPFARLELKDIIIGYYTAKDFEDIQRLGAEGKGHEALRLLTRGWAFRPEKGDYKGGKPLSLLNSDGEKTQ
jgi:hypothetical protein